MKNIVYSLGVLLMTLVFVSCEKEEFIMVDGLPKSGSEFLEQHFSGAKVSNVKKEKEGLNGTEYTAYLESGITVKFDKNGNWEEVEAPNNDALPTSFIPAKIVEYVQEHYPSFGINSIDKEKNRYDVELTNGLDLEFNSAGDFVRID
ncbi:MAG TPA: PepSY-like domain-containing protein [Sphingobacterium sp.]|nr:PepSY-like domain-containing protein [Sphingobacterium sp.]